MQLATGRHLPPEGGGERETETVLAGRMEPRRAAGPQGEMLCPLSQQRRQQQDGAAPNRAGTAACDPELR